MCFQVLDAVLGHDDALFRRAQLKALVSIHGKEVIHEFYVCMTTHCLPQAYYILSMRHLIAQITTVNYVARTLRRRQGSSVGHSLDTDMLSTRVRHAISMCLDFFALFSIGHSSNMLKHSKDTLGTHSEHAPDMCPTLDFKVPVFFALVIVGQSPKTLEHPKNMLRVDTFWTYWDKIAIIETF